MCVQIVQSDIDISNNTRRSVQNIILYTYMYLAFSVLYNIMYNITIHFTSCEISKYYTNWPQVCRLSID